MNKLLITGGSGFLGRRAALYYREQGLQVFTPTHSELDITDPEAVRRAGSELRPDWIVHCAAISDVGACDRDEAWSRSINTDGCVNVARAAGEIGAKCVLCSSDQVYFGSEETRPHAEAEVLTPKNLYGREKLEAERRSLAVNPDAVLLRLTWM